MSLKYSPPLQTADNDKRCPRCHAPCQMVVVHGHEQFMYCKSNVLEFCSKEGCETTITTTNY